MNYKTSKIEEILMDYREALEYWAHQAFNKEFAALTVTDQLSILTKVSLTVEVEEKPQND